MKKLDFRKYWDAFVHGKGWASTASFFRKVWCSTASWKGWKIPIFPLLLLSAACTAGLIGVFAKGLEVWVPAYFLYALSAYCLTALCVKLPAAVRSGKTWFAGHPKAAAFFQSSERKFTRKLYREQIVNFAYGSFKIGAGILYGSAWTGCDGIYNFVQAMIQLFQILRRKNAGSLVQQWKSYRFCGVLILLLHLSLTGIVFQMINWNRAEELGEVLVIATAAFAFYKITTSFLRIARDRKHAHPVDSSVRMLNLAQAIFAIFSLQASMLHTFGTGESWEQLLNIMTGCVVCLLIASMGVYMLRRGPREIKQLQESNHGE